MSSHFGKGNHLAFFDLRGWEVGPMPRCWGGLHHMAVSVEPEKWEKLKGSFDAAGIEYLEESVTSISFRDPDAPGSG